MLQTLFKTKITPALVIYETILKSNIERAASSIINDRGIKLRPHFKTSKILEVATLQREYGAVGFTCATVEELQALCGRGFLDLFFANQPIGYSKIKKIIEIATQCDLKIALDSMESAIPVSEAAIQAGIKIPYLIEIDTGLGRAGVAPSEAFQLAKNIKELPGLILNGIFGHEGHLYLTRDIEERKKKGREIGEMTVNAAEKIRKMGIECDTVSVGSTPGLISAPFVKGVTEARPGTYVFNDENQNYLGVSKPDSCAVQVVSRIISRPKSKVAIIDAGLKAMSSDRSLQNKGYGSIQGSNDKINFYTAFEEHGVLTGDGVEPLEVGDLVGIIPNHACGTVNMWSKALVVRNNCITAEWSITARH